MSKLEKTKILLVEDEDTHAELISRAFAAHADRFSLIVVSSLEQAKEYLAASPPQLVIIDLFLPDGKGIEILNTAEGGPLFPVIVITGQGDERVAVDAIKAGALDYVVKSSHTLADMPHIVERAFREWGHIIERKEAEKALQESEERYRLLVETMNDALIVLSKDERLTYANPKASEVLGYSLDELIGFSIADFFDEMNKKIFHKQLTKRKKGEKESYEIDLLKKDGTKLSTIISPQPLFDDNGFYQGSIAVITDITERKQSERERIRLEGQLRQAQKMEAIGTLSGGIAHDFNNILTAILGNTEISLLQVPAESRAGYSLDQILKACHRARELVQQILAFSRKTELERKPVSMGNIVNEATKLLRASIPQTIEIRQKITATKDTILADPTEIHQVLMNLCTNAYHAMAGQGGLLEVILVDYDFDAEETHKYPDLKEGGGYVKLAVCDSGYGMTPDIMERIFDPYFTTKEKGVGAGMGLSVVHGIIKNHRGAVYVDSVPGKGTVFNVFLPLIESDVDKSSEDRTPLPTGNERILFVDDEESLVNLAERMLGFLGYEIVVRTSSEEALKLFRDEGSTFDLVISDMVMPQMTGKELAEEVFKIRPDIPFILCTGFSDMITEAQAKEIGICNYIMKPFDLRKLAVIIRQVLGQKGADT